VNPDAMKEAIPKFYGASTIGERSQLVIPAEARKDMGHQQPRYWYSATISAKGCS